MLKGTNQNLGSEFFEDESGFLLKKGLGLEFYHVPTGRTVKYKAFLTGYEDSFKSNWNKEDVYGRNDQIHTFQNTVRSITLSWDVPAASLVEAQVNFSNASLMYSMLYPTYDEVGTISAPPLVKLKFGNLIQDAASNAPAASAKEAGLLGHIDGLTFSPDLEAGFFDEEPGYLVPQTIKLSCVFHVLHTHPLGWDQRGTLRKHGANFPYNADVLDLGASEKNKQAGRNSRNREQAIRTLADSRNSDYGKKQEADDGKPDNKGRLSETDQAKSNNVLT